MPTYDYRCKDCGHEFEIHQSFSEDALTECPVCKGSLRKVFSAVGISFKGSGFYKTDSRGSSSSAPSPTTSSESASSSSSDTSSSSSSSATSPTKDAASGSTSSAKSESASASAPSV